MRCHPDQECRRYLVRGFVEGFRVGFQYGKGECRSATANMQSVRLQPHVIDEYLANEVRLGRVIDPLDLGRYPEVHFNRFGLVPKNHQPGRWRLIVDLSHPSGGECQ